jgi:hypothetical protein
MNTYTFTWKKYLPVIRLLLKRSATGVQSVKLDSMDFNKGNRKSKVSHSFKVEMGRGRLLTINASPAARDLFEVFSEDDIARTFIRQNKYEISLNSDFELKIDNIEPAQPVVNEEIPAANAADKDAS